jgi:hypothetical protein
MNDLETLHDAWELPEAPSPAARDRARAALLAHAAPARPRRRRRLRLATVGAVAAAGAAAVIVIPNLGGADPVPPASAQVLERAAVAAERRPFTAPRDDQWIYTKERGRDLPRWRQERWSRADGGGHAGFDPRWKLTVEEVRLPGKGRRPVPGSYESVAALPAEPDALLRWVYEQARNTTGGGADDHGDAYLIFNHTLRDSILPPALEAAIFRAMKRIPGVTVETVDVFGRPALALGLDTSDWLHEELLLDPETYAYRGERSTVTRDARIDPLKAGNETGEVTKGSQVVVERVETAIVDEPGERP